MLRIEVDMNRREDFRTIVISPKSTSNIELKEGMRVILHEPGIECEAILRHGTQWQWVADIIEGTVKDIPIVP